uniref:Uncharacterized protein n=1 Tax=Caenorhabditis japonica TaxID=281687 RepID=A0A8R1EQ84_CAEJA
MHKEETIIFQIIFARFYENLTGKEKTHVEKNAERKRKSFLVLRFSFTLKRVHLSSEELFVAHCCLEKAVCAVTAVEDVRGL